MKSALDTNVLSLLWSEGPLARRMEELLGRLREEGALVVCGAVYAELLAYPKASRTLLHQFLADTGVEVDFDTGVGLWELAGANYAAYCVRRRRSGGGPAKRMLTDFIIGAHALLRADRLATLDQARYRAPFPKLVLIA